MLGSGASTKPVCLPNIDLTDAARQQPQQRRGTLL
jgi:hypothetical protein